MSRLRIPLYVQLLAWLALNLVLIGALFFVFAAHNQTGWNLLLTQSVRDRLEAIGQSIATDLYDLPLSEWEPVLKRHGAENGGVRFTARRLGGPPPGGMRMGPPGAGGRPLDGGPRGPGDGPGPAGGGVTGAQGPGAAGGRPGGAQGPGAVGGEPGGPLEHSASYGPGSGPLGPPPPPPPGGVGDLMGPRAGADARPRFIDIHRSVGASGYDVAIDVSTAPRGGPPHDVQVVAHVSGVGPLLQLLGIGREAGFLVAILLLSALLWWPFVWGMTRTIRQLRQATQQMSQGRLEVRVSESRRDELGELATAVNSMAERLHTYLQGQRQFIADVAHEVISPIARMQIGLGILETHVPERGASALLDVREDLEQMAQMLDELLLFSRSGMESDRSPLVPAHLHGIVTKVVTSEASDAHVKIDVPQDIYIKARPAMLERALSNLVRNARRYAAADGSEPIEITATRQDKAIQLLVSDRGPGVPEAALTRLGEPFFRPELSRSRATGGFGLGLAIVRRCVAACNGEVRFRNRQGGGFEAELSLLPEA